MIASTPRSAAARATSADMIPLSAIGPGQRERYHSTSSHVIDALNCFVVNAASETASCSTPAIPTKLPKVGRGWVRKSHSQETRRAVSSTFFTRDPRREHEAAPDVPLALAQHRRVDGDHEGAVAGGLRALDQHLDDPAVPPHVELVPDGAGRRLRDLLHRADRHGAGGVDDALPAGGPRGHRLAARPEHAGEAGRREDQRRRDGDAEDGRRLVPPAHVLERPGPEPVAVKSRLVGAERDLVLGAAVDVVEQRPRQPPARRRPEVVDRDDHDLSLLPRTRVRRRRRGPEPLAGCRLSRGASCGRACGGRAGRGGCGQPPGPTCRGPSADRGCRTPRPRAGGSRPGC